jgi:hypothetical protein
MIFIIILIVLAITALVLLFFKGTTRKNPYCYGCHHCDKKPTDMPCAICHHLPFKIKGVTNAKNKRMQ